MTLSRCNRTIKWLQTCKIVIQADLKR